MLHILLWIIKIIGTLLAVVLGILLVAILCVLFVPIRYTIKADGKLGEEEPLRARVKISWLFHIVNAAFIYPEEAFLRVRIFCFTIFNSSKQKTKKIKEDKLEENQTEEDKLEVDRLEADKLEEDRLEVDILEEVKPEKDILEEVKPEENKIEKDKLEECTLKEDTLEADNSKKDIDEVKSVGTDKTESIKTFFGLLKKLWNRFVEAVKNIEYTIHRICDRIREIVENIQYYTEVLQSDVFHQAWQDCKKQLFRILRMLKPSKCRVNLLVGTGDPGSTGQLWSIYGMLYPVIGNNVFLQTDFENQIVEGDLYIKGKIKVWVLLLAAFRLFIDKDIRRVLKLLKREEK